MRMTDKARKVWIFKWLLKKSGCLGVHLEKNFIQVFKQGDTVESLMIEAGLQGECSNV